MSEQPTIERGQPHPESTRAHPRTGLLVRTPYLEDFVTALKVLPWHDRLWMPDVEAWWVDGRHEERCIKLITHYFGGGKIITLDGPDDELFDRLGRAHQGRLL